MFDNSLLGIKFKLDFFWENRLRVKEIPAAYAINKLLQSFVRCFTRYRQRFIAL